jgi:hypothetical protein
MTTARAHAGAPGHSLLVRKIPAVITCSSLSLPQ